MSAAKSLADWEPLPAEITDAIDHCAAKMGHDPSLIDPHKLSPAEIQTCRAVHAEDTAVTT